MPWKPNSPCSHRGCPALSAGRYCPEHEALHSREFERHRPSSSARGYGRKWQRLSKWFLDHHPWCQAKGCTAPSAEVDHIVPKREGGTDEVDNLQALCKACHSRKTSREVR